MKRIEADVSDATLSKGGQVTSEEKVKRLYPDAATSGTGPVFVLPRQSHLREPLWIGEGPSRESAWADAWERIQKAGSVRNG